MSGTHGSPEVFEALKVNLAPIPLKAPGGGTAASQNLARPLELYVHQLGRSGGETGGIIEGGIIEAGRLCVLRKAFGNSFRWQS